MSPFPAHLLKIDLEKDSKRCGDCAHVGSWEIVLTGEDAARLDAGARLILNRQLGQLLPLEDFVGVIAVLQKLDKEKVVCRKRQGWIRLLEAGCTMWQPRGITQVTP